MEVSNNYFKKLINECKMEENFQAFAVEFQFATFLNPVSVVDDRSCVFGCYEIDGKSIFPLFTDLEEFNKSDLVGEELLEVTYRNFEKQYKNEDFGGFVINPATTAFEISPEDCVNLINFPILDVDTTFMIDFSFEEFKTFLKGIDKKQTSINNDDLLNFIQNNFFLSFMETEKEYDEDFFDVSNNVNKSIFTAIVNDKEYYILAYTTIDEMKKTKEGYDFNIYGQLLNFKFLTDFTLFNDLDGIIINVDSEEPIIIPRNFLINNINEINANCNLGVLKNSHNYGFKI